jgi:hypothetical protein
MNTAMSEGQSSGGIEVEAEILIRRFQGLDPNSLLLSDNPFKKET